MGAEATLTAACHSAACAPPPAGTGGSTKGARGALARAKAAITAPGSNVDRTGRNSFDKYHSYEKRVGSKPPAAAPAAKKKPSGARAALARAWQKIAGDTSAPAEDITPVPEVRREGANMMLRKAAAKRRKPAPAKSYMVTRAEARRSRGGADIPMRRVGKLTLSP